MTLIDTFIHIIDGFDYDTSKIDELLTKTTNKAYDFLNKIIDKI